MSFAWGWGIRAKVKCSIFRRGLWLWLLSSVLQAASSGLFFVRAPFDVDVLFTLSGVVSSPGSDCRMVVTVLVFVLLIV